jgi:hypothetical protein
VKRENGRSRSATLKPQRDQQGRYLLCLDEAAANSLSVQRRSDHEAGREGQNLIFIRIANTPAASHYGLFGIFDFRAE